MNYRPIPTTFSNHGFTMRLIKRAGDTVIYAKSAGFEVLRVRRHDGRKIKEKVLEPAEYLPSDEQFGTDGFYFAGPNAAQLAEDKVNKLVAMESARSERNPQS